MGPPCPAEKDAQEAERRAGPRPAERDADPQPPYSTCSRQVFCTDMPIAS